MWVLSPGECRAPPPSAGPPLAGSAPGFRPVPPIHGPLGTLAGDDRRPVPSTTSEAARPSAPSGFGRPTWAIDARSARTFHAVRWGAGTCGARGGGHRGWRADVLAHRPRHVSGLPGVGGC